MRPLALLRLALCACTLNGAAAARADEAGPDEIRDAVRRGEMRTLAEIETRLAGRLPGEVIKVEAERKDGGWVYEFRTIDAAGRRADVYVDALSGDILRVKRK